MNSTDFLHALRIPRDKIIQAISGDIGLIAILFETLSIDCAEGVGAATDRQINVAADMTIDIAPR